LLGVEFKDFVTSLGEIERNVIFNEIHSSPFIDETHEYSLYWEEKCALGLAESYYTNIPSVSIDSEKPWDSYLIELQKETLSADGDLLYSSHEIKNIGLLKNLENTWFESLIPNVPVTLRAFTEYLTNTYENVSLAPDVLNYLRLNPTTSVFNKIERAISALDGYAVKYWKRDAVMWSAFNKEYSVKVRPETDKTLSKHGDCRHFVNEEGNKELYSLHFDMPNAHRGYLKEIKATKKIFISTIVPHLPTAG
jgi:hypothetical protein